MWADETSGQGIDLLYGGFPCQPHSTAGKRLGSADSRDLWPDIADAPHLTPAIEPGVRVLADGLAYVVDESRVDQLRAGGNGVVPLQAAVAFRILGRRLANQLAAMGSNGVPACQ